MDRLTFGFMAPLLSLKQNRRTISPTTGFPVLLKIPFAKQPFFPKNTSVLTVLRSSFLRFATLSLFALLVALRAYGSESGFVGFPAIEVFRIEQTGMPWKSWGAAQDSDGVMYFGRMGITSFDGERWKSWPMNNAYGIRALAFGADGRLWAGGTGEIGWFSRKKNGWVYHSLVDQLPEAHRDLLGLWHVFPDGDGAIFAEDSKIMRWDGRKFQIWSMPSESRIRAFPVGKKIYVHRQSDGLHELTPSGPQLIIPTSTLGEDNGRVWWIRPDGNGYRIINGKGFATLRDGILTQDTSATSLAIKNGFAGMVLELPGDLLAIATVYSGVIIARADGSAHQTIGPESGLPTQLVNGLFLGRDNQLWAMAESCIARISAVSPSRVVDQRSGLPSQPVIGAASNGDNLAVATENAIYEWDPKNASFVRGAGTDRPLSRIAYTSEGLASSGFGGLRLLAQGKEKALRTTQRTSIFALTPSRDRPGSFYLAEDQSVLRWTPARSPQDELLGKLPEIPTSFADERSGSLWIGTTRSGIFHVDTRTAEAKLHAPAERFKLPTFTSATFVSSDLAGTIYVLSQEGGWLKRTSDDEFKPIAGMPKREVAAFSPPEASPELWVALRSVGREQSVVGRIAVDETGARWVPQEIEAIANAGNPHAIVARKITPNERILWIGGSGGLVRSLIDITAKSKLIRPPLLTATMQASDGKSPELIDGPIPYDNRTLRFEFAAPEFHRRGTLRIETFIEGIDHDWMPVGKDASRELTAVRDGHYRLLARTVSDTGMVSDNAELRFRVLPPWWRTTPMLVAFALGMIPLGYGFFYLRTRALRRRNAALEARVQERTKELEAANAELAAASAAKTEFVANMSHDIRNPLNGIVGLALALEDSRLDGRQREMVATLRECTGYLSTLVDDVLDFASIEAGRIELRPGPLAPGELLRSIVTTLKSETAERGATLLYEVDPELPPHLLGDAGRVQQILVNFVSNALKYAGGTIQLSATRPADAPGEVEFAVRDWGPGMNEEDRSTLFKKFSRLTRARQEGITGTGLGLASCRLLADIMGGSVGVESEPGKGSRFFLRLPLTVVVEKPEPAPRTLPQAAVLLVEDTDYNAWAAKAVLARLGLACDRARDGAEAVRMFEEKRYNVVLLDRNLPDMDGLEVAKRIRASETDGLQAVILAVTAYATAEDRQLCLDAGMDAFVGKPLTPDKLRRALLGAGRKQLATATVDLSRPATNPPMSTPSASAASSQPEPAPATLDLALLTYLSDGTSAGFGAQVERFLETLSTTQSELATALASRDFEQAKVFAHRINGQAKMVGYAPLAQATLKLEESAFQHDPARCADDMEHVNQEIEALRAAMASPSRSLSPA